MEAKKMNHTRRMMADYRKKDRISQIGIPVTDRDFKDAHDEIKKFENDLLFYSHFFVFVVY